MWLGGGVPGAYVFVRVLAWQYTHTRVWGIRCPREAWDDRGCNFKLFNTYTTHLNTQEYKIIQHKMNNIYIRTQCGGPERYVRLVLGMIIHTWCGSYDIILHTWYGVMLWGYYILTHTPIHGMELSLPWLKGLMLHCEPRYILTTARARRGIGCCHR